MRRHTTKHPRGAATTARPRPARRARIRKGSATSGPVVQRAVPAGRRLRLAGQVVPVVVVMVIERESAPRLGPEQTRVLGMLRHRLRHTGAAHMSVEADDAVA